MPRQIQHFFSFGPILPLTRDSYNQSLCRDNETVSVLTLFHLTVAVLAWYVFFLIVVEAVTRHHHDAGGCSTRGSGWDDAMVARGFGVLL